MFGDWWIILAIVTLLGAFAYAGRSVQIYLHEWRFAKVRRNFHTQRERLEAKFVCLARAHSKSKFPRWEDCDFDDDVAYVRNRTTGELCAFVAITVVGAEPGATFDTQEMIGNLRAGTAVFRFDRKCWETDGKAFMNLSPTEAVQYFQNDLEMVEQELAHRAF